MRLTGWFFVYIILLSMSLWMVGKRRGDTRELREQGVIVQKERERVYAVVV